jgi:hypothetical protein
VQIEASQKEAELTSAFEKFTQIKAKNEALSTDNAFLKEN